MQVDADANIVGGAGGAGNVISGNQTGVELGGDDNVLQGNLVGTTPDGTAALPNNYEGVHVLGSDNRIGGTGTGERNVISGNLWSGIKLDGLTGTAVSGNVVSGNLIGTDIDGTGAIGNGASGFGAPGVMLLSAPANRIGGTGANAGDVIAASGNDGIAVDQNSPRTRVLGNHIGTDVGATLDLGNAESGVSTVADHTDIGDGTAAGVNVIAHNGEHGVVVADCSAASPTTTQSGATPSSPTPDTGSSSTRPVPRPTTRRALSTPTPAPTTCRTTP